MTSQAIAAFLTNGEYWSGWWSIRIYGLYSWMVGVLYRIFKNAAAHDRS